MGPGAGTPGFLVGVVRSRMRCVRCESEVCGVRCEVYGVTCEGQAEK